MPLAKLLSRGGRSPCSTSTARTVLVVWSVPAASRVACVMVSGEARSERSKDMDCVLSNACRTVDPSEAINASYKLRAWGVDASSSAGKSSSTLLSAVQRSQLPSLRSFSCRPHRRQSRKKPGFLRWQ